MLGNILKIDSSRRDNRLQNCRVTGFYDVSVPFFGAGGAARMFAPQKGAGPEMVDALDSWMARLCSIYSAFSGREIRNAPGSGSAGGIGGAIRAVLGAAMSPGIGHVLDIAGMDRALETCDLVITGEDVRTIKRSAERFRWACWNMRPVRCRLRRREAYESHLGSRSGLRPGKAAGSRLRRGLFDQSSGTTLAEALDPAPRQQTYARPLPGSPQNRPARPNTE